MSTTQARKALSFLKLQNRVDPDDEDAFPLASADAVVEEDEIVVWEWDFETLQVFWKGEREVSNALSA
jgi:hypothetical protein